jgi:hypothetical protein
MTPSLSHARPTHSPCTPFPCLPPHSHRTVLGVFTSPFGTAWEALLAVVSVLGCAQYVVTTYSRHWYGPLSVSAPPATVHVWS